MADEIQILDLSSKTFDGFVKFFFARAVVPDKERFDYFLTDLEGQRYDEAVPSSPGVLVSRMTKLFSEFGRIARDYSLAQLDQGICGILGANLRLHELLWNSSVALPQRLQCVRSMCSVYSDFVSVSKLEASQTGFFMWWDLILIDFWVEQKLEHRTERDDTSRMDTESRILLDAMFETLKCILELPDWSSRESALHGLGHLYHPDVRQTVQQFMDNHGSELTEQRWRWVTDCRDGRVL
jgi:hypothetical protein